MPKIGSENKPINPLLLRGRGRALVAAGTSLAAGASLAATAGPAAASAGPTAQRARQPAPVPSPEFLSPGDIGPAVKQLQRALHLRVDGLFGSATRAGVMRFQRRHRLMVDGVVGPQTRRALHVRVRIVEVAAAPVSASHTATPSAGAPAVTSSAPASSSTASGGYSIPASIVMCESGGSYSAYNPSSGAGGAYQILPSTWAAYGGTGSPQTAPPAEQNAIAAKIWAASGPSAWSC